MEKNGKNEKINVGCLVMYTNNLKRLRNEKEYTQQYVADKLGCKRTTYNNWERGVVMIPISVVDKLSLFYKVSMTCILGLSKKIIYKKEINKMSYDTLLTNLNNLKNEKRSSYEKIGKNIKCTSATCQRYFTGKIIIPIDRLIMLCEIYGINLDELCGKERKEKITN